jgi:superfamily II DNA or RNA helicase
MLERALVLASDSSDDELPGTVYALVLEAGGDWPEGVTTRCRVGSVWSSQVPDAEIVVTAQRSEYDILVSSSVPALLVPSVEAAALMVETWGMRSSRDAIKQEIRYVAESPATPLLELFPHLRVHRPGLDGWTVTRCTELEEITRSPHGLQPRVLSEATEGNTVLVLLPENDDALLSGIDAALQLGLGEHGRLAILDGLRRQQGGEHRRRVRQAATTAAKLLALVGEQKLRTGLPSGLEEAERRADGGVSAPELVAELAIHAYGDGVLRHYGADIRAAHDDAPGAFNGSISARRFVDDLRFPEGFAGSPKVSPPELEEVFGPTELPGLHPYQEQTVAALMELLSRSTPGRGLLRLPTGAGKTRVAVEAIIRVMREGGLDGPVLWIAQADELCEQAVQSWKFVWSKVGPRQRLTVNRFWGGNSATPVTDNPQLVVATDVKLEEHLKTPAYAWLREASVVVVDEAHRAVNKRYTALLEQLGLSRSRTERPLVGLTATPFRPDEDETRQLVGRFGGYRLDDGLFPDVDPYSYLQDQRMLARVDHRELPGATVSVTDAERASAASMRFLPSAAEERIGQDHKRNETLLKEIASLDPDWPVLVFAASVNHSKLLTAMLNRRGISSAAIDNDTPTPERRALIERFRRGGIRVITNFGVLAQGFDAPATRVVVIARPTYSPNLYQQMIGRGLRGPRNGGEERCLILDVKDNIVNWEKSLAFTGFEHLWRPNR